MIASDGPNIAFSTSGSWPQQHLVVRMGVEGHDRHHRSSMAMASQVQWILYGAGKSGAPCARNRPLPAGRPSVEPVGAVAEAVRFIGSGELIPQVAVLVSAKRPVRGPGDG
ncbi:hypothetical protein [Allonocardiopsis opalescens]|uniref:hypothetical protein n=1 Tax=Allonocardiopsis opalescens TaxID=1144618 RepID=UPI0011B21880|nr:hypothetical protein [Allonocardiopsis opalescens]